MEITISVAKTEYVEKKFKVVKYLERLPKWIKPFHVCPMCKWNFNESREDFHIACIELSNGDIQWIHQDCLDKSVVK